MMNTPLHNPTTTEPVSPSTSIFLDSQYANMRLIVVDIVECSGTCRIVCRTVGLGGGGQGRKIKEVAATLPLSLFSCKRYFWLALLKTAEIPTSFLHLDRLETQNHLQTSS